MNKIHKRKKVYKVVSKGDSGMFSTYAPRQNQKIYRVGEVTLPIQGTKLFCFMHLRDARAYAECCHSFEVYEAIATNVQLNGWLAYEVDDTLFLIDMFTKHTMPPSSSFKSVAICDSLILTERVEPL